MRHHSRHGHWGGHHGHDHRSEAFAAFAEKFAIGRGHRGGFGRRGGGGDEDGSEGFGRGFGGRGGGGRLLGHGDLRLLLLALIGLHVLAILFYRVVRGENLVGAMVSGSLRWTGNAPILRFASPLLALIVLAGAALLVWVAVGLFGKV